MTTTKKNRNWVPIVTLIFQTLANFFASLRLPRKSEQEKPESTATSDIDEQCKQALHSPRPKFTSLRYSKKSESTATSDFDEQCKQALHSPRPKFTNLKLPKKPDTPPEE